VYWFTGFLARPVIECPSSLPVGAVWREIVVPFHGVGVRFSARTNDKPAPAEVQRLLAEVGLGSAAAWVYLSYVTWAGHLESVYGLGASGSREFGPAGAWDESEARAAYLELMGEFGVVQADALNFPPFARGFWGEA
jgi:hypothetical protein